jgi:hypothetical protein
MFIDHCGASAKGQVASFLQVDSMRLWQDLVVVLYNTAEIYMLGELANIVKVSNMSSRPRYQNLT